ncbi:MAG: FAD-dependent oxidoreductase, partial [Myxococcota bacterium]
MNKAYDYLVIGAGSGGLASAKRAASYGAKVAIFESARIGGTCVNQGCVPKKVMWNAATLAEHMHELPAYGFPVQPQTFQWSSFVEKRDAYVRRLNDIHRRNIDNANVDYITGHACFQEDHCVRVNSECYTAPHILIATGGKPRIPTDVKGHEQGI